MYRLFSHLSANNTSTYEQDSLTSQRAWKPITVQYGISTSATWELETSSAQTLKSVYY